MPAASIQPSSHIRSLQFEALPRAMKWPTGEPAGREDMAKIIGISTKWLNNWCKDFEGFGESGCWELLNGNKGYRFQPIATIWWLIGHFEREHAKAVRLNLEQRLAIDSNGSMAGVPSDLSIAGSEKLFKLHSAIRDSEVKDGLLVDAAEFVSLSEQLMVEMKASCLAVPSKLDPLGQWDTETRDVVDDVVSAMIEGMSDASTRGIEKLRAARDSARTDRTADQAA